MTQKGLVVSIVLILAIAAVGWAEGEAESRQMDVVLDTPCLVCHQAVTPGIVDTWADSAHYAVDDRVRCLDCHQAMDGDPSGKAHQGYQVTAVPSPNYCATCHPSEVAQNARSKHAWTGFIGQYKPYYLKARSMGLDPMSQETAKLLDPDTMAETAVTPLIPDSGILKKIDLLGKPGYEHNNVTMGCSVCHGTFVIVEDDGSLAGWPNTGIGRINPDGSLGSCSSCHTRHVYSKEEARKPDTCGQCHLGPDHPQHEIYEESKHGNIFAAMGESWNWDAEDWGTDDINAPTCATCHMSAFNGVVEANHDVGDRLYWELQPKRSVVQWRNADMVDDIVTDRVPDQELADSGRAKMKSVCYQCHSNKWVNGYFVEFDKVVSDYNQLWDYTDQLLQDAYEDGLVSKDNPIDEMPEIYHYLIWHHSGRRWRMGAAMMGPDWTHWNGAVDTIMIKLGSMISDLEMRRQIKSLKEE